MDSFTVPVIRFSVLYCFFVIRHDHWRILRIGPDIPMPATKESLNFDTDNIVAGDRVLRPLASVSATESSRVRIDLSAHHLNIVWMSYRLHDFFEQI